MSDVPSDGLNRRDVLKRGALVGGALVWTVPAIQTIAAPAFAAGSQAPGDCVIQSGLCVPPPGGGPCAPVCYQATSTECCAEADRIDRISDPIDRANALLAYFRSSCGAELSAVPCPTA